MLAALLVSSAWAAGDASRFWKQVYDARLVDAMYGDVPVAVQLLEEPLGDMEEADPERGDVLYWLGRARLELGNVDEARALLRDAAAFDASEREAIALLALIELDRDAVDHLPYTCTFDKEPCRLKRAWHASDKGALEVRDEGDASVLAWDTTVRGGENDELLVALAPTAGLHTIAFRVRGTQMEAELRVSVADGSGGRWSAKVIRVPTDTWLSVELPMSAFSAAGSQAESRSPTQVRVVEIEDLSGMLTTDRGPNTLVLDDFSLR